jgi:hypothetical protein
MSRRTLFGIVAAALILVAGWTWAQPKPAEEGKPPEVVGRYAISPIGNTAVMVDTATGKAWVLRAAADDAERAAWLPTVRLDTDEEMKKWRGRQRGLIERAER